MRISNVDLVYESTHLKCWPCLWKYTSQMLTLFMKMHISDIDLVYGGIHLRYWPCIWGYRSQILTLYMGVYISDIDLVYGGIHLRYWPCIWRCTSQILTLCIKVQDALNKKREQIRTAGSTDRTAVVSFPLFKTTDGIVVLYVITFTL